MSVRLDGSLVRLEGDCRVEDAEPLLALLQEDVSRSVDLATAGPLHAAVLQILLAYKPSLAGPPGDPFTARWVAPLLDRPSTG